MFKLLWFKTDVNAVIQENYSFVTHNGKLEIHKPDNSLLHSICRLEHRLGVCLDQSGAIYIAGWNASKVWKYTELQIPYVVMMIYWYLFLLHTHYFVDYLVFKTFVYILVNLTITEGLVLLFLPLLWKLINKVKHVLNFELFLNVISLMWYSKWLHLTDVR